MHSIRIRARHFRVYETFDWQPEGLCLLAGANGAGKTTALDMFTFLRGVFWDGHESALASVGGTHLRRTGSGEEPMQIELEVGEVRWLLRFPLTHAGLEGSYGEELYRGDELILRAAMFSEEWYLGTEQRSLDAARCCAKVLWDRQEPEWMLPFVEVVRELRVYQSYWLNRVRSSQATDGRNRFLHGTGQNLWSVLASWKLASMRNEGRFEWVVAKLREAFPDLFRSLEFDNGLPWFFGPDDTDPADGLPPHVQADGLLTGILHLTALAGAQPGSIVMFDEVENQLHPHAIRVILAAMSELAADRELTIVVTTHSPVVMDTFRQDPDQFYVLEPASSVQPVPLDQLHDPDWLAQFSLGELYDRLAFGAPKSLSSNA